MCDTGDGFVSSVCQTCRSATWIHVPVLEQFDLLTYETQMVVTTYVSMALDVVQMAKKGSV